MIILHILPLHFDIIFTPLFNTANWLNIIKLKKWKINLYSDIPEIPSSLNTIPLHLNAPHFNCTHEFSQNMNITLTTSSKINNKGPHFNLCWDIMDPDDFLALQLIRKSLHDATGSNFYTGILNYTTRMRVFRSGRRHRPRSQRRRRWWPRAKELDREKITWQRRWWVRWDAIRLWLWNCEWQNRRRKLRDRRGMAIVSCTFTVPSYISHYILKSLFQNINLYLEMGFSNVMEDAWFNNGNAENKCQGSKVLKPLDSASVSLESDYCYLLLSFSISLLFSPIWNFYLPQFQSMRTTILRIYAIIPLQTFVVDFNK